jgi:hypothetical protein
MGHKQTHGRVVPPVSVFERTSARRVVPTPPSLEHQTTLVERRQEPAITARIGVPVARSVASIAASAVELSAILEIDGTAPPYPPG